MELVTIFRDTLFRDVGKDSGVEKINSLCPRGGDGGFCPRGVAGAVAVAGVGVDPRGGDAGFCPRGFVGAVVGAGVEGDGCAIGLELRCTRKDDAGCCTRVAARAGAGAGAGGGFLGGELPLLPPLTGEENGSSSVTTMEDLGGFTSIRFTSADIAPLIDGTGCGGVGIVVAG